MLSYLFDKLFYHKPTLFIALAILKSTSSPSRIF